MVLMMLVSVACLTPTATPTQAPAPATEAPISIQTEEPAPTQEPVVEPTADGSVSGLQNIEQAMVRIVTEGTYVYPDLTVGLNESYGGSGFIVDPSGIAITNNHVVTGAALVKVYVGDNQSQALNARVLGVSECSDLAVIDIEGDGYPFLKWYDGPLSVGMDVYVAGYPLGDPEFSLNKGIISKAKANGRTSFASVESVVEFDATSNHGNSGGPLVSQDGQVVGVVYSGIKDTGQNFAISRDTAKKALDQMRPGKNLDTIGISGEVYNLEDGTAVGVWVSAVASGSPADKAGIQGGDIITMMENLVLGTDGTMGQYCDILRSHSPDDTLSVTVYRPVADQWLDGQVNGRQLAVTSQGSGTSGGDTSGGDTSGGDTSGGGELVDSVGDYLNVNATGPNEIIYQTEFENGLDNWAYFLMSGKDENFTQEAINGKFRTEINVPETYVYYSYEAYTFQDVRIDTKVENLGSNTNNVGMFCRYSDRGWYEGLILSNGEFQVWVFDANAKNQKYTMLYSGASRLINLGKKTNEYTMICKGETLTLGINGTKVKDVKLGTGGHPLLRDGQVGLTVNSSNVVPVIVEFENFSVSVPE